MSEREIKRWDPIPHWNNFTVPELKEILMHCEALEQLGIAQDTEMMTSIRRDVSLRGRKDRTETENAALAAEIQYAGIQQ
jgi:hypothetical protein